MRNWLLVVLFAHCVFGCGSFATGRQNDASAPMDVVIDDAVVPVDLTAAPDVSGCPRINEVTIRAPVVVMGTDRVSLAATAMSAGCGCVVHAQQIEPRRYILQQCDCSNDPCVDPNYVWNGDSDLGPSNREPTPEQVIIGTLHANITRLPVDYRCSGGSTTINNVMVVTDNDLRQFGPRRVWAYVRGTVLRCSLEPLVYVEARAPMPLLLQAMDCNNTDCDGPMRAVEFGVWVNLGMFAPGNHTIVYPPANSVEFVVR